MTARSSGDPTLFSGAQASSWGISTQTTARRPWHCTRFLKPPDPNSFDASPLRLQAICRHFAGNQAALPHKYPRQPPVPFGIFSPLSSPSPPPRTHRAPSAHRISAELDGRYVPPVVFLHGPSRQSLVCQRLLLFFQLSFRRSFDRGSFLSGFRSSRHSLGSQHTPRTRQQHREIRKSGLLVLFLFVFPSSRAPRVRVLLTSQLSGKT